MLEILAFFLLINQLITAALIDLVNGPKTPALDRLYM